MVNSGEPPSGAPGEPGGDAEATQQPEDQLSDSQRARLTEAAEEIAAVRAQLAQTPPEVVITNHVMGLYELAAIHLNKDRPDLVAARLAIDALSGVLAACQGRLGESEPTLTAAQGQIQLAFVSVSQRASGGPAQGAEGSGGPAEPPGEAPPGSPGDAPGGEGDEPPS